MAAPTASDLSALTGALSQLVGELSKTTTETKNLRLAELEMRAEVEETTEQLIVQQKLNESDAKSIAKLIQERKKYEKEVQKATKDMKTHAGNAAKYGEAQKRKIANESLLSNTNKKLERSSKNLGVDLGKLGVESKALGKSFRGIGMFIAWLTGGLLRQRQIMKDQIVANAGLVEGSDLLTGLMTQQAQALARGISPAALGKIMASQRMMVNAMGGIGNTLEVLDPAVDRFFGMTMNLEESYQLAAEAAGDFTRRGIVPSKDAMMKYTQDVEKMARISGQGAAQIAALFREVEDDTDFMYRMRLAREGEHQAIVENQRALIISNQYLGMTAEQAKDAAKMLNRMVAAKPLERIKQAARLRALGAAFGIGGAEEAAQAVMAGRRMTGAQEIALRDFSVAATNAADAMSAAGFTGELLSSTLLDKLDLDQYMGKDSPFSTRLGKVMADGVKKMENAYTVAANSQLVQLEKQYQILEGILAAIIDGTLPINALVAGFKSIIAFFSGGSAANWLSEGFEKTFPKLYTIFSDVIGVFVDGLYAFFQKAIAGFAMFLGGILPNSWGGDKLYNWGLAQGEEADRRAYQAAFGTAVGYASESAGAGATAAGAPTKAPGAPASSSMEQTAAATVSAANGIQQQISKMDESAAWLKTIAEVSEKQLALTEKQLAVMTLSEEEKKEQSMRLRMNSPYYDAYGNLNLRTS